MWFPVPGGESTQEPIALETASALQGASISTVFARL